MRLLCILNGGADHPSSRFRVLQHLPALRAQGLIVDTFVAKKRSLADLRDLRRQAAGADAILIQKKLFSIWKLRPLLGATPVLFDFDDAVFEASPDESERLGPARARRRADSRRRRLRAILRRSRRVIAGNGFLAEYAARYARDVAILPTGLDTTAFPEEAVRRARESRLSRRGERHVGWIGSRSSLRYLEALAAPLRDVCARFPEARLVQVCNDFIDLPGVPIENRRWSAGTEAADLLGLDIGLMPLDESPFSRGKCGLKILQYHAAGLPVVCSPVGANRDMVRHRETGLFAATPQEWAGAIGALLAEPALGNALGEAGRRQLLERYAAGTIGARLAQLVVTANA